MNHPFARRLLCLAALLTFPALAQTTPAQDAHSPASAPRSEDVVAQINPSSGSERILSYAIDVTAHANNTLDVTETIRVVAQGVQIRRGLYRDFPTRYKDRYGNNVVVGFDVTGLKRDDQAEPWFTEAMSNGIRVNFGNDDFLKVPATYTYTLRYRTNRQVGFFSDHDELYWNAIGTGWDFLSSADFCVNTGQKRNNRPLPTTTGINILSEISRSILSQGEQMRLWFIRR